MVDTCRGEPHNSKLRKVGAMAGSNTTAESAGGAHSGGPTLLRSDRIVSVDLLRGIVMVIMALDHTRDFFTFLQFPAEDMTQTYGWLFFTRWITHYCAPAFFFLAGTGAFLALGRGKTVGQISRFFWTRGLWLVFLELTVIAFAWTFQVGIAGGLVIWALGWCMVLMSLIVRMPVRWIGAFGIAVIALHNLTDRIAPAQFGKFAWLWTFLHVPGGIPIGNTGAFFFILYTLVPWVGVMAAGYAFGNVLRSSPERRQRNTFLIGASATLLFIVLRATNLYGNPPAGLQFGMPFSTGPWQNYPSLTLTVISFLNVEKYPPSLQFLLMTLGPALMVLAALDRATAGGKLNALGRWTLVFGRVPMFYYICHLFLIHSMAVVVAWIYHQPAGWLLHGGFFANQAPPGYGHHLPFIYLIWALAIVILYFPCAWFAGVKQRRKDWWLSYI
jgi:uncharacterized membrane protein